MEKEIKNAVKVIEQDLIKGCLNSEREKEFQVLLTLAKQYLSVKLPEELVTTGDLETDVRVDVYNRAIRSCKLSMVKTVPSELDIEKIIDKICEEHIEDYNTPKSANLFKIIATALHQMFLGRIEK